MDKFHVYRVRLHIHITKDTPWK